MYSFGFFASTFGLLGFVFGITALAKIRKLEKRIEELETTRG